MTKKHRFDVSERIDGTYAAWEYVTDVSLGLQDPEEAALMEKSIGWVPMRWVIKGTGDTAGKALQNAFRA